MRKFLAVLALTFVALPLAAQQPAPQAIPASATLPQAAAPAAVNPFFTDWTTPFGVPPFDRITVDHFMPAFTEAIAQQRREVKAIADNPAAPTFENTVAALDLTGELLAKVSNVFSNLSSAETNEKLQAIARETSPMLSALRDDIYLDEKLFARVDSIWKRRATLKLTPEQAMLLEKTWKRFVRGGVNLQGEAKARLRAVNTELAALGLKFGDNLLKDTNAYRLVIERKEDLAGLPDSVVASGAAAAKAAGLEGKWVYTLQFPSIWPFLTYADNRELRRQIFTAYTTRCDHGDATDNKAILSKIAALRVEKAKLLGYASWADYVLEENMAKTPARVDDLLQRLWAPALKVAGTEAADLQAAVAADGKQFTLEPWDWFYYTEKVRKARYALDEQALREYFTLDNVRNGAFEVAHRLYGITFTERTDIPKYHPEVRTFEVRDRDGSHLAVFMTDYHPRPGKRVGAWSSRYREQYVRDGKEIRPVVVNVCNFSRPAGDKPALLSLEEVETLFHEFGHGLASILSRVHYRGLGWPRDFVELPSQIMENWATEPEVLKLYAKHWRTGEVIPVELVAKVKRAEKFNQGFVTVEYLAASLLDMQWHALADTKEQDATAFERATMARITMPPTIVSRYRSTYFNHIFGPGGGYSSGYYAYIWAEVLDSDAFEAFKAKGLFDQTTATSFRTNILEKSGSEEAMDLYRRFRGADPSVEPLLAKRGLK